MMTIINVPKVNIDTGICFIELVNFDYVSFVDVTVICSTYKVYMHIQVEHTLRYEANL